MKKGPKSSAIYSLKLLRAHASAIVRLTDNQHSFFIKLVDCFAVFHLNKQNPIYCNCVAQTKGGLMAFQFAGNSSFAHTFWIHPNQQSLAFEALRLELTAKKGITKGLLIIQMKGDNKSTRKKSDQVEAESKRAI